MSVNCIYRRFNQKEAGVEDGAQTRPKIGLPGAAAPAKGHKANRSPAEARRDPDLAKHSGKRRKKRRRSRFVLLQKRFLPAAI